MTRMVTLLDNNATIVHSTNRTRGSVPDNTTHVQYNNFWKMMSTRMTGFLENFKGDINTSVRMAGEDFGFL